LSKLNKQDVIIIGAGGHAKVVAEALIESGHNILGVISPDKVIGSKYYGLKVLANDEKLLSFSPNDVILANGVGVIPGKTVRWELANRLRKQGFQFIQVIHPTAYIAKDVLLGEGVQVMAGSCIQPGASIGQDSIVNTRVSIDHDCCVGKNCHLAPGVVLSGSVIIENGTQVGTGAVVTQGINIGMNVIIGAGSVIFKDLASNIKFIQKK
jgi:sugar O-acyltransferase (sialic acid O-acetyltransferase NeuD family)